MTYKIIVPRQPVPKLDVPLVNGENFVLGNSPGEHFDLLIFYRGLHCPICAKYLLELEQLATEFISRGIQVVAFSNDTQERGQLMAEKINAKGIKISYELGLQNARQWGLYISATRGKSSIGIEEPALFSEPGIFLVRPDGTLYFGSVQTSPFARPRFQDLLSLIDFAIDRNFPPARGEYSGEV